MDLKIMSRILAAVENANSISTEDAANISQFEQKRVIDESGRFKNAFSEGYCYLCHSPLETYDLTKPCLHWLLRPGGLKKKSYPLLFGLFGYFQMESYLRWVANFESPLKNINDLSEEQNLHKIIEITIKYKNFEWSFSCTPNDLEGHENSTLGDYPHFHFQMKIDSHQFICFNDYHVPFAETDLFKFQLIKQQDSKYEHRFAFGEGMEDLLKKIPLETLLELSESTEDETEASLSINTLIRARPGEIIMGEDILKLFQESKSTGIPIAKLVKKLDAEVTTIISPGLGVPELAKRNGRGN